jgi:hypothetical protein
MALWRDLLENDKVGKRITTVSVLNSFQLLPPIFIDYLIENSIK